MGCCQSNKQQYGNKNTQKSQPKFLIYQNVAIKSKGANKVMDVCQDADAKGMLIIYHDYKQANQRFDIYMTNTTIYIVSKKTNKFLTVGSNSDKNGAPIFQQPESGLEGQKFKLQKLKQGGNQYLIHTFCGKALDVCQQSTKNGARIIQYDVNKHDNQIWIIQKNQK